MGLGRLLLRAVVGALFAGHGAQKLLGWFGGGGPRRTGETMEKAGLGPGVANAVLAGSAEAGGGLMLAAGAATPLAAASLSSVMLTAIRTVHLRKGPWNADGGYEYPLVLLAAIFALTEAGPGRFSVDARRRRERGGVLWALGQLAAAAGGSAAVVALGRRRRLAPAAGAGPEAPQSAEAYRLGRAA
jgi:putative oxidoreductase